MNNWLILSIHLDNIRARLPFQAAQRQVIGQRQSSTELSHAEVIWQGSALSDRWLRMPAGAFGVRREPQVALRPFFGNRNITESKPKQLIFAVMLSNRPGNRR
jgi:hypothetical protein